MATKQGDDITQRRLEARAVKAYLAALDEGHQSRRATRAGLKNRLGRIESKLATESNPLRKLELLQSKLDIETALESTHDDDLDSLDEDFVLHAKSYSRRKGITYTTWRRMGVPAELLRRAGIPETRRRRSQR